MRQTFQRQVCGTSPPWPSTTAAAKKAACGERNIFTYDKAAGGSYCFGLQPADVASYPPINFEFAGGLTIPLMPSQYMRNGAVYCDHGQFGLGITSGGVADGMIFGGVGMQHFLSVFDRENNRIGFASIV